MKLMAGLVVSVLVGVAGPISSAHAAVPAPNDNFAQAKTISALPYSDSVNADFSALESGEPIAGCVPAGSNSSVWYRYFPAAPQRVAIKEIGDYQGSIVVWQGTSIGALSERACLPGKSGAVDMQATTQYYVQAIGTLGPSGKVMIDITIESFPPDVVGTVDWIDRIASVGPEDTATEIVMSPDGGTAYVTGTIGDYYGEDYVTVAYDVATGYRRWVNQYDGPSEPSFGANGSDVSTAIAISPDGTRLYVTGNAALASAFKYQTIAIDTGTGQTVWASIHHMSGDENGNAWDIAVSPDGLRLYVTGQTGPPFHTDFTTIAYQASSGLELWAKSYDGPAHGWDHASQIAVTPGGKILVSGFSQGSDGFTDFLTIAYSVTGKRVWVKRLDVADDVPTAMALSQDGLRVFVTGETFEGSQSDALTVAYRVSDGAKLWAKRFTGPAGDDSARAIVVARDGSRVFVTGISAGVSTASDQFTLAYSAKKGKLQWNKRLTSAGAHDDSANAIVTSTDGTKLFVAGVYGSASSGGEFLISSYSATDGALLWTKALDGPGHGDDAGRTVLVAADGYRVFVGGSTTNATPDFTVAAFWAK